MNNESPIKKRYFDWLYDLVCYAGYAEKLSYRELLFFLFQRDFYSDILFDRNREKDGIGLRYRFGNEMDIRRGVIMDELDDCPCSVLEMMISLAIRCETEIMADIQEGNRTWKWFWKMITNLNLGGMCDGSFDICQADKIVDRLLNREYDYQGNGSLFRLHNVREDARDMEIWKQMTLYLSSTEY